MIPKALNAVSVQTEFFPFAGGLNLTTPALIVQPGSLISVQNYLPAISGGYERPGGYERFSGMARPSDATWTDVACTLSSTPVVGTVVTIGAATGYFVQVVTGGCLLANVSGTIPASTNMTTPGPVSVGTTAATVYLGLSVTALADATYKVASADILRALITVPTGSGSIRGAVMFNGTVYCFRDNAGGTAGGMWKSTASGWTAVTLTEEIVFTNANASVGDADILTQGAVTATITRVLVETGTLASGTNTGRLIVTGRAGGNFAAGLATSTGGGSLTLSGVQTAITLQPGGVYSFDEFNFYGQLQSKRLYFTNGLNRGMEFDGTTVIPINSTATLDTPKFVKAHRNYLYLTIGSDLFNSSVGNPYRFVTAEGAAQTAVGDTITGLASLPGQVLSILCRNSSFALTGASSSTWALQVIRRDVGAIAYTNQTMSDTYMLDDRGIVSISTTQKYGNFQDATLSRLIQPLIDSIRTLAISSFVIRQKDIYAVVCSDGRLVCMGMTSTQSDGPMPSGFTTIQLGFTPSCAWTGEDSTGVERIFIGASNGHVYEFDVGSTFDGSAIESWARIFYTSSKSPRIRKRYRKFILELTNELYSSISVTGDLSFGDVNIEQLASTAVSATGSGGYWDVANWDQFIWDASEISQPEISLAGTGINISLVFYSNTKYDHGHTLQGGVMHYTPRRIQR